MKKVSVFILALVLVLSLASCGNNAVIIPKAAAEYVGKNYEDVLAELQNAGFSDIEIVEVKDLTSLSVLDDYAVGEISIDNNPVFAAETEFAKESKVIITYHTIPKLQIPISSTALQENDYETIASMFAEAGFSDINSEVIYDLNPDEIDVEFENEVSVNQQYEFTANEEVVFDSKIIIVCHRPFQKYNVTLHIDFVENWFFDRYGVTVLLDGCEEDSLAHGEDRNFEFSLKEGAYTIRFENADDSSIDGEIKLDVNSETEASYTIRCWSEYISVDENYVDRIGALGENEVKTKGEAGEFVCENYQEVIKTLKEWGFVNIIEKPLYDIYWGLTSEGSVGVVTIDGIDSYRRGDIFDKNVEVIVPYHLREEDNPSLIKMAKDVTEYEGKHYTDVVKIFNDLGFSNVVLEETVTEDASYNDGEVYRITIDYEHFDVGDTYKPEDTVLIKYYRYYVDPVKQAQAVMEAALESELPKKMAKRAVIVAMTNCQATDVFSADGNTYDPSQFHSYSDIGDFFMTIDTDGTWSAENEHTWRVEGIILRIYNYDTYLKANCSVKKDGDNYVVFNVDRTIAAKDYINSDDPSKINTEHLEPTENNPFLTVPESLISKDRDTTAAGEKITAKDKRQEWIDNQFHWWDKRHTELSELIKDCLNDRSSFKHVDASYIDVYDEERQTTVNKILKDAGYSARVEVGDLFVIQEFTAKNVFNATVKNTGYGIVRESDNSVILLGIE